MLGSDILCNILVDSCIEIFSRMLLQLISYNRDCKRKVFDILIHISLWFVHKCPINNKPVLVQIMTTGHYLNQLWRKYASLLSLNELRNQRCKFWEPRKHERATKVSINIVLTDNVVISTLFEQLHFLLFEQLHFLIEDLGYCIQPWKQLM